MLTRSVIILLIALANFTVSYGELSFDLTKGKWDGQNHSTSKAALTKPAKFDDDGALILADGNFVDVPGISQKELPSDAFTIEAHVELERGTKWGNIVGYMQDNGSYERGFSLGYNESSFTVWISTGGSAIYARAEEPFIPGEWYHILATYDGKQLKLIINSDLAATADAPGKIAYPDTAQFTIGAYRDKDEFYPMDGKLRSVRVSNKATTIKPNPQANYTIRPAVQFITPSSAKITWGSDSPGGTLTYGKTKPPRETISTKKNQITLTDLEPRTIYYYKLNGGKTQSFNTALNFTNPRIDPTGASETLTKTKLRKGYCLIFGADEALAEEIAAGSDFTVIGLDTDPAAVTAARLSLHKKKLYGTRISMMHVESYEKLPFVDGFANLLIADRSTPEIRRLSAPGRSTAIIAGKAFDSPKPTGHGDWSHQYGDPGNSANSGETLAGARTTSELDVRWFGRPGADFGLDRQSRMPAPLSIGGRLFHQGMDRLVALDANNGAVLWGLDIPDVRRLNMPRDASNWCADEHNLYLAVKERAWIVSAENGDVKKTLAVPGGSNLHWGYIARDGDRLFGSGVRPDSGYTSFWTSRAWFDGKAGSFGTGKVCSESLFAYSTKTSETTWTYSDGLIINPTIAVKSGRVYFIESRHPSLKNGTSSQITSPDVWKDQFLVALDSSTGRKAWERPIDIEAGTIAFYLQATDDTVLVTSSNSQFHFYAFAAKDGSPIWNRSNAWSNNHHSGHIQHPVILDNTLYVSPNGYSMTDGEIITTKVGAREGCHTYIGAGDTLIYRGKGRVVSIWDRNSETVTNWPRLRPSCWLSFIPANGMLLLPEGGGGCSCGGWMETSIGFAPVMKK